MSEAVDSHSHPPAGGDDHNMDEGKAQDCPVFMDELVASGLRVIDPCPLCVAHAAVGFHRRRPVVPAPVPVPVPVPAPLAGPGPGPGSGSLNPIFQLVKSKLLPTWSKTSTCRTFLQRLDQILAGSGIAPTEWPGVFRYVMGDDTQAVEWITTNILDKNLSWADAKKVFTSHYQQSDYTLSLQRDYSGVHQLKNESVQSYSDRFVNLCNQLGFDKDAPQTILHFTDHLLAHLKGQYQRALAATSLARGADYQPNTLDDVIAFCIKLDVTNNNVHEAKNDSAGSKSSGSSSSSGAAAAPASKKAKQLVHCSLHGQGSHSTADCRVLKARSTSSSPKASPASAAAVSSSSSTKPDREVKPIVCFGCNQPGHKKPDCPLLKAKASSASTSTVSRASSTSSSTTVASKFLDTGSPLDRTLPESVLLPSLAAAPEVAATSVNATRREHVRITYAQRTFDTLVDTGATVSLIDSALAQELKLSIQPITGKVILAADGTTVDRIGVTDPITVIVSFSDGRPPEIRSHSFEVLSLPRHDYHFMIGMDLIVSLFGDHLPTRYLRVKSDIDAPGPSSTPLPLVHVSAMTLAMDRDSIGLMDTFPGSGKLSSDEVPTRVELSTPAELEVQYAAKRAAIMSDPRLVAALQENEAITGMCNLPEAVLKLHLTPVSDGESHKLFRRQYSIPEAVKPKVTAIVHRWFSTGKTTLAPPNCPFNNAILAAPKRDDAGGMSDVRVCLDTRPLNAVLLDGDKFPLPNIRHALESLGGNSIFGEFDLTEAYLQFPLHPDSQPYTAFTWEGVQYMFVGCPFGISILPSFFQRIMSRILSDLPFTFPYLDNTPIGSKTWEEHLEHALILVTRFNKVNLKLKLKDLKLGHATIKLLGSILTAAGIKVDPAKVSTILNAEFPVTGKEMQSFLGMVTYLKPHLRHGAEITGPLEAVKNDKVITPTPLLREHFDLLKNAIARTPTLQFPDHTRAFYIATDASNTGVGAVLYQPLPDDNGEITANNIVAICSKKLNPSQMRYSAYKKELLGIVVALRHFHTYVWGRPDLVIVTDHKPLTYMLSTPTLSEALLRWIDVILDYKFVIVHRPGVLNVLPDSLSRMYGAVYDKSDVWGVAVPSTFSSVLKFLGVPEESPTPTSMATGTDSHLESSSGPFVANVTLDPESKYDNPKPAGPTDTKAVSGAEESAESSSLPQTDSELSPEELAIAVEKRGKTIPPTQAERQSLVTKTHLFGHFGREAMYKSLWNQGYWWPSMRADIRDELANCDACCRYTVVKSGFDPASYITASGPMEHLQMDTSVHLPPSPDGHTCLLVVLCVFTGFIFLRPLKTNSAELVALALWEIFCSFGVPKILQSDNGPEFVNEVMRAMVKITGMAHRLISPYNPRADGKVERSIGTVTSIIKKLLHGAEKHWPLYVGFAQLSFNTKVASLTNSTPFSLMFGRVLNELKDYSGTVPTLINLDDWKSYQDKIVSLIFPAVSEMVKDKKDKMVQALNKSRRLLMPDGIPAGSTVMMKDPVRADKFEPKYIGPYTIVRRSRNGAYVLKDLTGDLLDRHVPADQLKLVSKKPRRVDLQKDTQVWEVHEILKHRDTATPGQYEYLTSWKGYEEQTWEPMSSFLDDACVRKYWKKVKAASEVVPTPSTATAAPSPPAASAPITRRSTRRR
jgi:hypothetical protein